MAGGEVTDANTDAGSLAGVTATRFYTFGGATVAVRSGGGRFWLLFGDEQGSAQIMMPATIGVGGALEPATATDAANVQRTAYEPYGARRGVEDLDINRGWLGQTEDAGTGLTYLNARYYDPAIGRFLSPDPLMDPGDPRTLDPYRYADNNPIVFKDATGLNPSCVGKTGIAADVCWASYAVTKTAGTLKQGYQYILDNAVGTKSTAYVRGATKIAAIMQHNIGLVGGRVTIAEAVNLGIRRTAAQTEALLAPGNNRWQSKTNQWVQGALDWLVIDDYKECHNKGNAAGCAMYYSNFIPGGKATTALKLFRFGDEAGGLVRWGEDILVRPGDDTNALRRHFPGGDLTTNKSVFSPGESVDDLLEGAMNVRPTPSGDNFTRVVDAGRTVGTDINQGGAATNFYTVVTDADGWLVTLHPGLPAP